MNMLFAPVAHLMGRLRLSAKFLLIAVVLILPTLYMLFMLDRTYRNQIDYSERELAGRTLAVAGFELLEATQRHRDLSSLVLAGKPEFKGVLQQTASQLNKAMGKVDQALADDPLGMKPAWTPLRAALVTQLAGKQPLKPDDHFARYTALVQQEVKWLYKLSAQSGMSLDPENDTNHLQDLFFTTLLPASENASLARGQGMLIASRNTIEQHERSQLGTFVTLLAQAAEQSITKIDQGIGKDDASHGQLVRQSQQAAAVLNDTAKYLNKNYVEAILILAEPADHLKRLNQTSAALHGFSNQLLTEFSQRVETRIQHLSALRLTVVGSALLLVVIGAYLFVGATLSIRLAVIKLKGEAQRLAAGALSTRVELDSRDELAQIAGSFNHMAESLSTLVRQIRHTVSDVADTSQRLTGNASEVSNASRRQAESTAAMAAAVQQVTVSIAHANTQAKLSAERVLATAREARAGEENMQATLLDIRQLSEQIGRLSNEVEYMKGNSNQIGRIV